jgi:hypothetical protein
MDQFGPLPVVEGAYITLRTANSADRQNAEGEEDPFRHFFHFFLNSYSVARSLQAFSSVGDPDPDLLL